MNVWFDNVVSDEVVRSNEEISTEEDNIIELLREHNEPNPYYISHEFGSSIFKKNIRVYPLGKYNSNIL